MAHGQVQEPFESRTKFYTLLEFVAPYEPHHGQSHGNIEECMEQGWVVDGVMSQSLAQAEELWKLREYISKPSQYSRLIRMMSPIYQLCTWIYCRDWVILSVATTLTLRSVGSVISVMVTLHLNILKPENMSKDDFFSECQIVNKYVFETVQKYGGSVSAEHGVGMTKKPYLNYSRSETEIEYLREVKKVFDPNNIMNRGKIFDM